LLLNRECAREIQEKKRLDLFSLLRACTTLRQQVIYGQMYIELIHPIDERPSVSCLMFCIELKINYKCICVYQCVAISIYQA
jgi:hypothetical protein